MEADQVARSRSLRLRREFRNPGQRRSTVLKNSEERIPFLFAHMETLLRGKAKSKRKREPDFEFPEMNSGGSASAHLEEDAIAGAQSHLRIQPQLGRRRQRQCPVARDSR